MGILVARKSRKNNRKIEENDSGFDYLKPDELTKVIVGDGHHRIKFEKSLILIAGRDLETVASKNSAKARLIIGALQYQMDLNQDGGLSEHEVMLYHKQAFWGDRLAMGLLRIQSGGFMLKFHRDKHETEDKIKRESKPKLVKRTPRVTLRNFWKFEKVTLAFYLLAVMTLSLEIMWRPLELRREKVRKKKGSKVMRKKIKCSGCWIASAVVSTGLVAAFLALTKREPDAEAVQLVDSDTLVLGYGTGSMEIRGYRVSDGKVIESCERSIEWNEYRHHYRYFGHTFGQANGIYFRPPVDLLILCPFEGNQRHGSFQKYSTVKSRFNESRFNVKSRFREQNLVTKMKFYIKKSQFSVKSQFKE